MDGETVRLRMGLGYDGAPFRGWARQPGLPSVQAAVEDALALVFRMPYTTVVAGRTDTGVHARHQTVHVDVPEQAWRRVAEGRRRPVPGGAGQGPQRSAGRSERTSRAAAVDEEASRPGGAGEDEPLTGVARERETCAGGTEEVSRAAARKLNGALNRVLGKDRADRGWEPATGAVVVHDVAVAAPGFDARFSALSRGYSYRISDAVAGHDPLTRGQSWWLDREVDVAAMDEAVRGLLGLHDFLSFCKPREGATTVRELQAASVRRDERGTITVALTADAFCHHMVRSVVGAAVRVGEGRRPSDWPHERLLARERDASVLMAPAHGLVLEVVHYPGPEGLLGRAELTRAKRATS
ncbi:hypothetical protein KVA01_01260 [Kocuria varians]|uniref:tRNA pseudouridine synthase A n=1 Tax=Kocuria varians TaxID=1272 RepID=A0A4Y4CYL5_KOCVA|nr:tRNA pseudouridine synthase A [Kocuria varians]GEC97971.1 hypothetical protein KVA01_01260 [Kocuria varians]